MEFPIIHKMMSLFERYYNNGYLGYAVIGLCIIGLYTIIKVISQ